MAEPPYDVLRRHYERCLAAHGDSHLGVNWSRLEDAERRYEVMLGLMPPEPDGARASVLDFGCGAAHFYAYMQARGRQDLDYSGLDISPAFVALAQGKYPDRPFYCLDVLTADQPLPGFDYLVLNGVFTAKATMGFDEMWAFTRQLLLRVVPLARRGLAFNFMTKYVDWERDDLFHLPFDTLAAFLQEQGWRRYVIRSDYGLYDYTVYLYR